MPETVALVERGVYIVLWLFVVAEGTLKLPVVELTVGLEIILPVCAAVARVTLPAIPVVENGFSTEPRCALIV
jgi:hypothetical protein